MKSLINSKAWAMVVVFMALSLSSAMADGDDFLLSVRNVTQPTASTIEFDLYLLDTDNTQTFEFAALQMGLLLNTSIYGAGTLTVTYSNTGSGLDLTQQFAGSVDVVAPLAGYDGKTLIRLMANSIPPVPPGAGTGTVISSAGDGTFLAHFTITGSVSFTPNTRAGLEFCSGTAVSPLWPTVLYAYIDGNSTPLAVIAGTDAIVDGDPLLNPRLPAVYDITGGEPYCAGLGGSLTGLSGSEADATYTVYRNGFPVGTINGTGNPLSFGLQPASTLIVYASNIAGTAQMNGELTIEEIPNNTISLTSGAGSNNQAVCINSAMTDITFSTTGATGIGTPVNLPAGVIASWAADVITISGTPTVSGTFGYSIPLTGGCGTVSATGTITVNALPTITVSTAPSCSTDLLTYSLEVTVSSGTVTSSTGTVTDLGGNVWRIAGVAVGTGVTVTVTDLNSCDNSVSVTSPDCSCPVVAAPVSGGNQSYCAGESLPSLTVTVGAGETADWYNAATEGTLLSAGNTTYTPTAPGTYYAAARITANNCVSSTRTAVTLTENPLPVVTLGTLPAVCLDASPITLTQGSPSGGTYSGPGVTNGTTGLFDPSVAGAGTHTITYTYTNGTTGCTADVTGTITVTANMTAGPASSTPTLCIGTVLTSITHATTGATGIGTPVNLPTGLDAIWEADVITISGAPTESGSFGYIIPLTGGCGSVSATGTINVTALPGAAGSITGPPTFTPGSSGVAYSVNPISAASTYIWTYSGTGVTINGSGTGITLDFSVSATAGTLSVFGRNSCGDGAASTLPLSPSTKTLTMTSVLMESLYNGAGTMREVSNGYTSQFPGIADRITVELHEAGSYSTIVYSVANVDLSLNGTATLTIPAEHSGNYYITIRHRNSIETTTSSPVSFAGSVINQSFALTVNVFGGNLKPSGDGYYLIFGADVNQDGIVDTGDMNDVDNGSASILIGYNVPDANGDGLVDTSDMNMVDNNSAAIVYVRLPF